MSNTPITNTTPQVISCAEAKALDLKFYFTGKPCKRGHTTERRVHKRDCVACYREGLVVYRAENAEKIRAQQAAYRKAIPEKMQARKTAWRTANPEKVKKWEATYHAANQERMKAQSAAWRTANPERMKALTAAWRAVNPEKVRTKSKAWREANLEKVRAYDKAGKHVRRARKRNAPGRWTSQDVENLLAAQYHSCAGCDVMFYEEQSYHIDHMIPLSRGGSNWPANLQILCPKCNCSKGTMTDEEWRASARFPKIASVFACT